MKTLILAVTHIGFLLTGFVLGIYLLPILTAPPGPSNEQLDTNAQNAEYQGSFKKDLAGSDFLHWGEGQVTLNKTAVTLRGTLAPGPDYKLYLSPVFVQTETEFENAKATMVQVGDVKTFENFHVTISDDLAESIALSDYNTVIVWCESFGEFITSAQYR